MDIINATKLAAENVLKEGLTDIFPPPHELEHLRNKEFRKHLATIAAKCIEGSSLESLDIKPIEHVLLPKSSAFDFRRCALMQPFDTIKYLALTLTMADKIELERPSNSQHVVFSYRYRPCNGYIFNPKYNISFFRKYVTAKCRHNKSKYLVTCDISAF